jgi:hypothetical protein
MALDLRHPQWKALLARDHADGTIQWSRSGSPSGWADFLVAPINPDGTRNLVLHRAEDEFEPKQLVILGLRPAGFSAHWSAGCRSCDRWVRTLFAVSQSDPFKCRTCSNLTYASVQKHDARSDLARRDPVGFAQSRARAPNTIHSQLVTAFLAERAQAYRPGRGWGKKSITSWSRMVAQVHEEFREKWGFELEEAGKVARGG